MTTVGVLVCKTRFKNEKACDHKIVSGNREFDPRPKEEFDIWIEKVRSEIKKQLKRDSL